MEPGRNIHFLSGVLLSQTAASGLDEGICIGFGSLQASPSLIHVRNDCRQEQYIKRKKSRLIGS
jgi:hypothetical protein